MSVSLKREIEIDCVDFMRQSDIALVSVVRWVVTYRGWASYAFGSHNVGQRERAWNRDFPSYYRRLSECLTFFQNGTAYLSSATPQPARLIRFTLTAVRGTNASNQLPRSLTGSHHGKRTRLSYQHTLEIKPSLEKVAVQQAETWARGHCCIHNPS